MLDYQPESHGRDSISNAAEPLSQRHVQLSYLCAVDRPPNPSGGRGVRSESWKDDTGRVDLRCSRIIFQRSNATCFLADNEEWPDADFSPEFHGAHGSCALWMGSLCSRRPQKTVLARVAWNRERRQHKRGSEMESAADSLLAVALCVRCAA